MAASPDDDVPMTKTYFNRVPLELLLRMTDDLSTRDIANLRLTCRSLELSLVETFAKEFFTKKQFMLTESSLEALIGLARSRFGHYLKHVIIGSDFYTPVPTYDRFAPQGDTRIPMSKYAHGLYSQQALLESGHALNLLTTAFAELKKHGLPTVGIRDYASELRKNRDGSGARWNSYGARTVLQETGVNLIRTSEHHDPHSIDFTRVVFRLVLQALGLAGATPSSFEILRRHTGGDLRPSAFFIPAYLEDTVLPVLRKLDTLFLPLHLTGASGYHQGRVLPHVASPDPANPGSSVPAPLPDYALRQFLGHLPNLKHLRLNMYHGERENTAFLRWLSETSNPAVPGGLDLPLPPPPVHFPSLVELDLGFVRIDPDDLLRIVNKFAPTLTRLELWKISLDITKRQSPSSDPTADAPVSLWAKFLKTMRAIPKLELRHLMIGDPSQRTRLSAIDIITFKTPAPGDDKGPLKRSYTGQDMKAFIKHLESDIQASYVSGTAPGHGFGLMLNGVEDDDEDDHDDVSDDEDEDMSDD